MINSSEVSFVTGNKYEEENSRINSFFLQRSILCIQQHITTARCLQPLTEEEEAVNPKYLTHTQVSQQVQKVSNTNFDSENI